MNAVAPKTELKDEIIKVVDSCADELCELSKQIHDNPELGFEEVKACKWLTSILSKHGVEVQSGVAGVPTAFVGSIDNGDGPTVGILCEYDALPEIGHACGHNVIAASGVGAGIALAAVKKQLPKGKIRIIGTPAEEGGGGKLKLIEGGVFNDVDCAMMIHGFDRNMLHQDLLGITRVTFEFHGKASHASCDPWEGINALDACIQTFNAVSLLRQQVRPDCRIHGIITNGGAAPNIIPEYASAKFYIRAPRIDEMWKLYERVVACAEGAAKAAGAKLTVTQGDNIYEPMNTSKLLSELFGANLKKLGIEASPPTTERIGSSDIGNVSQLIPTIHAWIAIAPFGTAIHTREFAAAAAGPMAKSGILLAAKTMAMTAVDLLSQPERVGAEKREFAK